MINVPGIHKRYYNNPLCKRRKIWELLLVHYSFTFTKRISTRASYDKLKWRRRKSVRAKKNPVSYCYESNEERAVWGRFHI